MTNVLFNIWLSALLSLTSLCIILFRVSPLSAPFQAIPAFFLSLFLSMSTIGVLAALLLWRFFRFRSLPDVLIIRAAFREGILLGSATIVLLTLLLLGLLNVWASMIVLVVFGLLEAAFHV